MMDNLTDILRCCICRRASDTPVVLLDCLHNCCEVCIDRNEIKTKIECPACKDLTSIEGRPQNRLAAAELRARKLSGGSAECELCTVHCNTEPYADNWCRQCNKGLCDGCASKHNESHEVCPVPAALQEWKLSGLESQICEKHGGNHTLFCMQCNALQCNACVQKCLDEEHSIQALSSAYVRDFVRRCLHEIEELISSLDKRPRTATAYEDLIWHLQESRKAHMETLNKNKKALLDAVDRAHKVEADLLNDYHDLLVTKAAGAAAEALVLDDKVEQAIAYAKIVLSSGDTGSVLQQHQLLLSRVRALVDDVTKLSTALGTNGCIALDIGSADNVEAMCRKWIGVPRLLSPGITYMQPNGSSQQSDVLNAEFILEEASTTFKVDVKCWDLAVTTDGLLLLATGELGLKEYNTSGIEQSSWSPPSTSWEGYEYVYTVEVLQDQRAAVGLYRAQSVVLLRRVCHNGAEATWFEDQRICCLHGPPWRLAAHGQQLAVAGMWQLSVNPAVANELVLVCWPCGRPMHRKSFGWRNGLQSAVVTDYAIVAAGQDMINVGLSDKQRSIITGYNRRGQTLWEEHLDDKVRDMCATPSGRVIWVALEASSKVAAVSTQNGHRLADVLSTGTQFSRLSMRGGQTPLLALLSRDNIITVYHAVSPSSEDQK